MSTMTRMHINKEVEIKWANSVCTRITIQSVYGSYTDSVSSIQEKLKNPYLLGPVRSMFQMMMDFYNKEKKQ